MQLTQKGKKNLRTLIILGFFPIVYIIISILLPFLFFGILMLLLLACPVVVYFAFHDYLHKGMEIKVLNHFGFRKTSRKELLKGYILYDESNSVDIDGAHEGQIERDGVKLIKFGLTFGSGKRKEHYRFVGLEFNTVKDNFPVQICDQDSKIKRYFEGKRKLESNEFNAAFKVFSKDPKHAFYQLDPDTMHDLMEIKKHLGSEINIEMSGYKVLVYTKASTYDNLFKGRITFSEALNQEITAEDLAHYHKVIPNFLQDFWKVFRLLDLQSQKIVS